MGIGTSSPVSALDVTGAGTFGALSSKIKVGLNGDSISSDADFYIQTSTANPLILRTNFTERMRIDSAGRVGIGTSSPASTLEIAKNNQTNGATLSITNSHDGAGWTAGDTVGSIDFRIDDGSAPEKVRGQIKVFDDTSVSTTYPAYSAMSFSTSLLGTFAERMRIDSAGNVGIGTSSPATKLEVEGDSNADTGTVSAPVAIRITDTSDIGAGGDTTNPYAALQFFGRDTSNEGPTVHAQIGTIYDDQFGAGSHLTFSTWNAGIASAAERMRISSAGVVEFKGGITEDAVTLTGTSTTIDISAATNFVHALTGTTVYTFSNPAATGNASSFTLKIIQSLPARTITWPASVDWAGGTAPTLTATSQGVDVFTFYTIDGGTTYYGFTAGQAMA